MDANEVIVKTKKIEGLLRELGASGKGLHELLSSIQSKLPAPLIKRGRMVATIRNKFMHDDSYRPQPSDVDDFNRAAEWMIEELQMLLRIENNPLNSEKAKKMSWGAILGAAGTLAAALAVLIFAGTR